MYNFAKYARFHYNDMGHVSITRIIMFLFSLPPWNGGTPEAWVVKLLVPSILTEMSLSGTMQGNFSGNY
jgi:hypothetical protein